MRTCEWCGAELGLPARGRTPRFCSSRCRTASHRFRRRQSDERAPRFPVALTGLARWVRADGKRPIQTTGAPASTTQPSTWVTFAEVQDGPGDGFGVMLGSGLACIDLDGCLDADGTVTPVAQAVLDATDGAWVERSMSGLGLHVFVLAPEASGRRAHGIEVYSRARFIRVTGDEFRAGELVRVNLEEVMSHAGAAAEAERTAP